MCGEEFLIDVFLLCISSIKLLFFIQNACFFFTSNGFIGVSDFTKAT